MSEPTKEQIKYLRESMVYYAKDEGHASDLRTLLAAYEERGQEIERLRAMLARLANEYDAYVEGVSGTGEPDPRFGERFPALVEALAAAQSEGKPDV